MGGRSRFLALDRFSLAVAAAGLALRLFIIFLSPWFNASDLGIFYWAGSQAKMGHDPYLAWKASDAQLSMGELPLAILLFAAVLSIFDAPQSIQIFLALSDTLNVLLLGFIFGRQRLGRGLQTFYALGPLTLFNFTLVPEDESLLLLFLLMTILAVKVAYTNPPIADKAKFGAIAAAGILASLKLIGLLFLPALAIALGRTRKKVLVFLTLFAAIFLTSHLLWAPSWLLIYRWRVVNRLAAPMHTGLINFFSALHLYNRWLYPILTALSLLTIYILFAVKKVDIIEMISLSVVAGTFWLTYVTPVTLAFWTICLLVIFDWHYGWRPILVWGLSFLVVLVAAASWYEAIGGLFDLSRLHWLSGDYGSLRMILLSHSLFGAVLTLYIVDVTQGKRRGLGLLLQS
ncbi:MAG TPA: hypothetical protein DCP08_09780 [Chloroflexi bacterium]|nr:hypothetical protein [Chloroflexota bacterium]